MDISLQVVYLPINDEDAEDDVEEDDVHDESHLVDVKETIPLAHLLAAETHLANLIQERKPLSFGTGREAVVHQANLARLRLLTEEQLRSSEGWWSGDIMNLFVAVLNRTLQDRLASIWILSNDIFDHMTSRKLDFRDRCAGHYDHHKPTKLLVPLNVNANHWVLVECKLTTGQVVVYDSLRSMSQPRPTIQGVDDLIEDDRCHPILNQMKSFVQWCAPRLDVADWTLSYAPCVQQEDAVNCGPFTAFNMWQLVHDGPFFVQTLEDEASLSKQPWQPGDDERVGDGIELPIDTKDFDTIGNAVRMTMLYRLFTAMDVLRIDDIPSTSAALEAPLTSDHMELATPIGTDALELHDPLDPLAFADDERVNVWKAPDTCSEEPRFAVCISNASQERWLLYTEAQIRLSDAFQSVWQPLLQSATAYTSPPLADAVQSTIEDLIRKAQSGTMQPKWVVDLLLHRVPVSSLLKFNRLEAVGEYLKRSHQLPKNTLLAHVLRYCQDHKATVDEAIKVNRADLRLNTYSSALLDWFDTIGRVAPRELLDRGYLKSDTPMATPPLLCSYFDDPSALVQLYGCGLPVHFEDVDSSISDGLLKGVRVNCDATLMTTGVPEYKDAVEQALRSGHHDTWVKQRTMADVVEQVLFFIPLDETFKTLDRFQSGLVFAKFKSDHSGIPRYGWTMSSETSQSQLYYLFDKLQRLVQKVAPDDDSHTEQKPLSDKERRWLAIQLHLMQLDVFGPTQGCEGGIPYESDVTKYGVTGALATANAELRAVASDLPLVHYMMRIYPSFLVTVVKEASSTVNKFAYQFSNQDRAYASRVCGLAPRRRRKEVVDDDEPVSVDLQQFIEHHMSKGVVPQGPVSERAMEMLNGSFLQEAAYAQLTGVRLSVRDHGYGQHLKRKLVGPETHNAKRQDRGCRMKDCITIDEDS